MRREARRLRDVHNEQLGTERLEKDAYRTMALRAEQRAVEAELSASKSESKVAELREQLDRAMEQLEVLETLHDAYSSKDPRDQHDQHDQDEQVPQATSNGACRSRILDRIRSRIDSGSVRG